ncbi:MAG: hypothetical protein LBH35_00130 [Treponema sp.]|jgi:hypothetical protein|nr:hypothetical protein [Treponema sp.]
MRKRLFLSFTLGFLSSILNSQSVSSPDIIGREIFTALKSISNSNGDNFVSLFLKREDGNMLYRGIIFTANEKGVINWNRIEYLNYIHKEFIKDGISYSSGFLAVKLNGNSDYPIFGLWLLNIKVGNRYRVLKCNDEWSRDSEIPWDMIRGNLNGIQEQWVD